MNASTPAAMIWRTGSENMRVTNSIAVWVACPVGERAAEERQRREAELEASSDQSSDSVNSTRIETSNRTTLSSAISASTRTVRPILSIPPMIPRTSPATPPCCQL